MSIKTMFKRLFCWHAIGLDKWFWVNQPHQLDDNLLEIEIHFKCLKCDHKDIIYIHGSEAREFSERYKVYEGKNNKL